jgi:hypothetical protein
MLRARVISEGIRTVYPGVLTGEYTPEEVMDFQPAQNAPRIQIIENEEPVDGLALYVPDVDGLVKLYKMCAGDEDWKDTFLDLFSKVGNAKKLSDGEKQEKLKRLKEVNDELFKRLILNDAEEGEHVEL